MLYDPNTQTLIEVAPVPVPEARLQQLAQLKGGRTDDGFVAQVAVLFLDRGQAEAALPDFRRFGLELRAMSEGGEEVLHAGTRVAELEVTGTLLPVLREESWPHLPTVAHRPLLGGPKVMGPWVTFGLDTPTAVARVPASALEERGLDELEAEALANLAARTPRENKREGLMELVDEYAPEMILLEDRMRAIAAHLDSDLFLVSIPHEGSLFAVRPEGTEAICQLARQRFDSTSARRISPLPILVSEGRPVGFAAVQAGGDDAGGEAADEEAPTKPWWKFW